MTSIRMSDELVALVRKTAGHCGREAAEIYRRTLRGMVRGRAVRLEIPETIYRSGRNVVMIRDFDLPEGVTHEEFRRNLAGRCLEALERPGIVLPGDSCRAQEEYLKKQNCNLNKLQEVINQ